jgi:hypothetical protein
MIHVQIQPEPPEFDKLVRQPGVAYLKLHPKPPSKQWKSHSYWRKIVPQLRKSYQEICAYCCHWIPPDTGSNTVEHFLPKDKYPKQAYEWNNYRLVSGTLNGRKGIREDVLDPFQIENGWFIIDFPSLLVKPAQGLLPSIAQSVQITIDILGLNNEGTCLQGREAYIRAYCLGEIDFPHLKKKAPFIAFELQRQGLVQSIKSIMCYRTSH